ncbi:MAG: ATP-binding protein [Firmicutes bacterium]|nr:ATP-binding protein [Bacillota bacterium]
MSIRLQWFFSFLVLITLILSAEIFIIDIRVKKELEKELADQVKTQVRILSHSIEMNLGVTGSLTLASQLSLTRKHFNPKIHLLVANLQGEIVFDSKLRGKPTGFIAKKAMEALEKINGTLWRSGKSWCAARAINQFNEPTGIIEGRISESTLSPILSIFDTTLLWVALGAFMVSFILSFAASAALAKPIKELEKVTQKISKGEWKERITFKRKDELGQLGEAIHDMAEKLQIQFQELQREKITLKALFSSMIDGLIVLDKNRNINFLNPTAEKMLRVKSSEASGKSLESIWPLKEALKLVSDSLDQKKILSLEVSLPYNVLKIYVIPLTPLEEVSGMVIFRDITEIRQLEEVRNSFLGQVSHELRTPLTIIKGYVITLLDDPGLEKENEIKKILSRIENESNRLTELVEELLEFSKFSSGQTPLTYSPVSLPDLVKETVETFQNHAERYQILLEYECQGEIPEIMGDSHRLKQVILNLLDNAVKYSPPGGKIQTSLSYLNEEILLQITDNGYGIPKEDLPNIFEPFFQGGKNRKGKGWGLGLPIVKKIIESHGGRIEIKSQENQGTVVTIFFPSKGLLPTSEKLN